MSQNQQLKASYQAVAWYGHTLKYLSGIDPALAAVFTQAMKGAGYPLVSAAEALEAICADFLAGPGRVVWSQRNDPTSFDVQPKAAPEFKVLTDEKIAEQEDGV